MLVNYMYCKKRGIKGDNKFELKAALKGFWDAKWALLMPVIILGGIYSGIFTATEAAVVATVYGIIIGCFVYKEVTFKQLWTEFKSTATFSGGMMWTVAPATAIGLIFTYMGVNKGIANFFLSISTNTYVVMSLDYRNLVLHWYVYADHSGYRYFQPGSVKRSKDRWRKLLAVRRGYDPGPGCLASVHRRYVRTSLWHRV